MAQNKKKVNPKFVIPLTLGQKAKTALVSNTSIETKPLSELWVGLGLGQWVGNLVGAGKEAMVAV